MKLVHLLDKLTHKVEKSRFKLLYPLFEAVNTALFNPDVLTNKSPYIRDNINNKRYIFSVVIALSPILLTSIYYYGYRVLLMLIFAYTVGAIIENLFAFFRKEPINEGFLVTGLLFTLIFPVTTPWWVFGFAIAFGIIFGKEIFGGVGHNPFNPALLGRVFAMISWPAHVSPSLYIEPKKRILEYISGTSDAISSASPLAIVRSSGAEHIYNNLTMKTLVIGPKLGAIGEISSLLIIIGGIYLLLIKVSNWRIPFSFILGSSITALLFNLINPAVFPDLSFQLFSGGLLLGAFFMATDPVTAPDTQTGKWIYGLLCGILIIFIRGFSPLLEGVMFSILIMNMIAPLIDEGIRHLSRKREQSYE